MANPTFEKGGNGKSQKYTMYSLVVIFGVLMIAGVTLGVVALLVSKESPEESPEYDKPASSIYEVMVGRGYWYAAKPIGLLAHSRIPHVALGVFIEPFLDCSSETSCRSSIRAFQADSFAKNLSDVPVNFLIGGDGNVYEGSGWEKYAYANDSRDSIRDFILVIGVLLNDDRITKRMSGSFQLLIKKGIDDKKIQENFVIYDYRKVKEAITQL